MSEKWDWKGPWKSLTPVLINEGTEALKIEGNSPSWDAAEPKLELWYSCFGAMAFPSTPKEGTGSGGSAEGIKRGTGKSRDQ